MYLFCWVGLDWTKRSIASICTHDYPFVYPLCALHVPCVPVPWVHVLSLCTLTFVYLQPVFHPNPCARLPFGYFLYALCIPFCFLYVLLVSSPACTVRVSLSLCTFYRLCIFLCTMCLPSVYYSFVCVLHAQFAPTPFGCPYPGVRSPLFVPSAYPLCTLTLCVSSAALVYPLCTLFVMVRIYVPSVYPLCTPTRRRPSSSWTTISPAWCAGYARVDWCSTTSRRASCTPSATSCRRYSTFSLCLSVACWFCVVGVVVDVIIGGGGGGGGGDDVFSRSPAMPYLGAYSTPASSCVAHTHTYAKYQIQLWLW